MALSTCRKVFEISLLAVFSLAITRSVRAEQLPVIQPLGIVVQDVDAQTLAMLTPVSAQLGKRDSPVLLSVSTPENQAATNRLIDQVGPDRVLLVCSDDMTHDADSVLPKGTSRLTLPRDSLQVGVFLAQKFWTKPQATVLVTNNDPATLVYASALAGHRRHPLLVVDDQVSTHSLNTALTQLGVKRVSVVAPSGVPFPQWAASLPCPAELLQGDQAQAAVIKTLGPQAIRNVIVARAPDLDEQPLQSGWLAAYLSVARKSVIVLPTSQEVEITERMVQTVVSDYQLKPCTVTLLADYDGVVENEVVIPVGDETLEIAVEPCSMAGAGGAADYGVGRIPYADAGNASLLIAWGLIREQLQFSRPGGLLMIANPNTDYGALPLAETVARFTEREYVNLKVPTITHFGIRPDMQQANIDAAAADLIIYQGHITDHQLFGSGQYWDEESGYMEQEYDDSGDGYRDEYDTPQAQGETYDSPVAQTFNRVLGQIGLFETTTWQVVGSLDIATKVLSSTLLDSQKLQDSQQMTPESDESISAETWHLTGDPQAMHPGDRASDTPILTHHALVFLQSCSSMHDDATQIALASDACGVIGSVTSIHSASGSSFVKAWSDAVLYRDATAGQAMRDARNYFLLLVQLKKARGHTQQAKTMRVGLSFRLLGDPELRVLPGALDLPRYQPVSGGVTPQGIGFQTPERTLKQVETDKYVVRAFPGSQTAGIVKRIKDKDYRRLMPLYYLRLPMPADGLPGHGYNLHRQGDTGTRAVYSTDTLGRYVYVIYFPQAIEKNEMIQLDWASN